MNKAHTRIVWKNFPLTDTPLNDTNLNAEDIAIDTIDDRVIALDTTKFNTSEANLLIKSITMNTTSGIMTITQQNGTTSTIDTGLAKLALNFDFDEETQKIVITLADGTVKYIDISAFITNVELTDSTTIHWTTQGDTAKADIIAGSITADKLQPNFLADCQTAKNGAITAQTGAQTAEQNSTAKALVSEGYANGTQNGTEVGSSSPYYHNNAKYWKEQAQTIAGGGVHSVNGENPDDDGNVDVTELKVELFTGNIDNAPNGICRMASGAVSWTSADVTVVTIASEDKKLQLALGNGSYSDARMRVYIDDAWAGWQVLPTYVVDDLNSNSPSGALSAKQGKILNDLLSNLSDAPLYSGSLDSAPLGTCRVASGGVLTTEALIITLQFNTSKIQYAIGTDRVTKSRSYTNGAWGSWANLPTGVVDNLTSTSATDALSANKGRDLQAQINGLNKVYFGTASNPPTTDNTLWAVIP